MEAIDLHVKFLNLFNFTHRDDELVGDDLAFLNEFVPMEGPHLAKITALKDKGNELFKQNLFDPAGFCYDKACRLLCQAMRLVDDYDVRFVSNLAVSLNLNLAACANKICEYEAAIRFCSLVLSSFPKNAKALFRRALAFMKSNMLTEAHLDLETAILVEPNNKDIQRELRVIKNLLAINSNGKRSEVDDSLCVNGRKGKKIAVCVEDVFHVDENTTHLPLDQNVLNVEMDASNPIDCDVVPAKNSDFIPTMDVDSNFVNRQDCDEQTIRHFNKKGGRSSQLRISAGNYNKLLQGKAVSLYQKSQSTIISVRVLTPPKDGKNTSGTMKLKKKAKRRRRRRRRRSKRLVREETTTFDPICDANGSYVPGSNSTPTCHIEMVTSDANMTMNQAEQVQPPLFLFAGSRTRKYFKAKRLILRKQCQGGESPRYILSTLSKCRASTIKLLRPCGVSVSCCRYPLKHIRQRKGKRGLLLYPMVNVLLRNFTL